MVSEEVKFRNAKNAFVGIDYDAMRGETVENSSQILEVLLNGDEDIIDVGVCECNTKEYLVHEPLECLSCISETKWHLDELKQSNGVVIAIFGMSEGVTGIWS